MSVNKASNFKIQTCDLYKGECKCIHVPDISLPFFFCHVFTDKLNFHRFPQLCGCMEVQIQGTWGWAYQRLYMNNKEVRFWWTEVICTYNYLHIQCHRDTDVNRPRLKTNCWFVLWTQWDDWREQSLKWVAQTWRNSAISWVSHYLCLGNYLPSISEDAAWRLYQAPKQHAPMVKTLVEDGDPHVLEALYINVSYMYFLLVSFLHLFSFVRVLIWPGGMTCVI